MTELGERTTSVGTAGSVWRPYEDDPILTPMMTLGWDAADPADQRRMIRYLSALVASRRAPVHVNVAFNALYFGYDLASRAYVGGLKLFDFPQVAFGDTTDALPVGAMVNIEAGVQPLFAEVVYKEGAHPALSDDGTVPTWLSGAPAGATGPGTVQADIGTPVLTERLVVDVDAFGADFSTTRTRLERLRQRGRWLDADGHLLLNACYSGCFEADLDETSHYARYLLVQGRDQLLSAAATMPLTAVLVEDAREEHLTAALTGLLGAVADALAGLDDVRMWRGYAISRAALAARLNDPGALGGEDLSSLAAGLARTAVPSRPSRWTPAHPVTYTAVGPRLRAVRGAAPRLLSTDYATAVCHANVVISDYAHRDVDDSSQLLPGDVHLRLDDPWLGGGVWRAEYRGSQHTAVDVTKPLGLGWLSTLPPDQPDLAGDGGDEGEHRDDLVPSQRTADESTAVAEREFVEPVDPVPDNATGLGDLTVTDSQISWTQALRLIHLREGRLPISDQIGIQLRYAGLDGVRLRLRLTHAGCVLDPSEATQDVHAELFGHAQLTNVEWPLDFYAGIVLTCTWPRGASVINATTTLLDVPVVIDGEELSHRYDPRILTRDAAPGETRQKGSGDVGTLSLPQRVLRAVRQLGLLDLDGRAVLARTSLPRAVGDIAGPVVTRDLDAAVDELLDAGRLRADVAGVDVHRRLRYPVEPGQPTTPVVIYEPRLSEGSPHARSPQAGSPLEVRFVQTHQVVGHVRYLGKSGREATSEARTAYRMYRDRYQLVGPAELPPGYTFVQPFTRGTG